MNKLKQAAQQILEALEGIGFVSDYWNEKVTALREALAEPQITTPDVCGEVCARAKLCYGCNKDLEEANAKFAEQAEQEPVAWARTSESGEVLDCISDQYKTTQPCTVDYDEPLYAAPVRTKDLTDAEVEWLVVDTLETWNSKDTMKDFARAVIAADREKNNANNNS